jgi:hypothetical protein
VNVVPETYAPKTTSEISRMAGPNTIQPIDSQFFNITDSESWPVAGLLVLLDKWKKPVRAELHLYEDLPSHIQEGAIRQSRTVLQERYYGGDPVPLRILLTHQLRDAMDVRLPADAPPEGPARNVQWRPVLLGIGAVAVVALAVWLVTWFSGGDPVVDAASSVQPGEVTIADNSAAGAQNGAQGAGQPSIETSGQPLGQTGAVQAADLPPSRNARSDLGVGMRVRIVDGLNLTLRTEAGATAGQEVGYMGNGDEALIIGGPAMTQGNSDTIVWWYVRLDSGLEAWAAANTSEQTLLIPAQ